MMVVLISGNIFLDLSSKQNCKKRSTAYRPFLLLLHHIHIISVIVYAQCEGVAGNGGRNDVESKVFAVGRELREH